MKLIFQSRRLHRIKPGVGVNAIGGNGPARGDVRAAQNSYAAALAADQQRQQLLLQQQHQQQQQYGGGEGESPGGYRTQGMALPAVAAAAASVRSKTCRCKWGLRH